MVQSQGSACRGLCETIQLVRPKQSTKISMGFIEASYPEPHSARTKKILAAHPEITSLYGTNPGSIAIILGLVLFQIVLALFLAPAPWWVILLTSFFVGAFANHALLVFIHDATHNLVFKKTTENCWAGLLANLPLVFPAAIGFRKFHLLHHRYQGEMDKDADLAGPEEAAWVGNSTTKKIIWLFVFAFIEGVLRPLRLKTINFVDKWIILNLVVQLIFVTLLIYVFGWGALLYLGLSLMFSIGLHPLGGRWIQEHYVVHEKQETYSYYGPINRLDFNVGYHNEHHDFIRIPWQNLPKVRALAPEFYNNLYYHTSYVRLLIKFLFDPEMTLFNRVVRPSRTRSIPTNRKLNIPVDQVKIYQTADAASLGSS